MQNDSCPTDAASECQVTHRSCAMPWQCDQMKHMNTRHIYAAFDEAISVFWALIGGSLSEADAAGCGWADVRQNLEFVREIRDGEMITVRSQVVALGRSSMTITHTMYSGASEALAAQLVNKSVRFDLTARCSVPIEPAIRKELERRMAAGSMLENAE